MLGQRRVECRLPLLHFTDNDVDGVIFEKEWHTGDFQLGRHRRVVGVGHEHPAREPQGQNVYVGDGFPFTPFVQGLDL